MYRALGYRDGQAEVLNYLGEVLTRSGDSGEARDHYARTLAIAREINTPLEEARALEGLGHCLFRDGDPGAAARWEQALAIYERIGAPDARRIQDSLRQQGIATGPPPLAASAVSPVLQAGSYAATALLGTDLERVPGIGRHSGKRQDGAVRPGRTAPVISLACVGDGTAGAASLRPCRPRYRPPARCLAPSSGRSL